MGIAAAGAALLAAAAMVAAPAEKPKESGDAALMRNLTTFNSIVTELQTHYVDSLAPDRAFKQAIRGLLSTVDPYTEYYASDEKEAIEKMTTGEFGGIGSYLMERDSSTYISAPMEDSPSARAGLRAGDRLMMVDTVDVSRMGSSKVTKLLRGVPETKVKVRVLRPYAKDSLLDIEIVRGKLHEPSMQYSRLDSDGTGYLQLSSFISSSPDEVRSVLEEFKGSGRLRNLVIDLRGNGGGLLESAVDIAGFFLPKGTEVVRTKGRDASEERIYKTTHAPILPDIPLAVLIDGGTASASEILAGALQDLDRAVLVGSRSYGKGLVQSTRSLPYMGLLKVTVAKYYIPSGRLIQALDYAHRNEDGSAARVPDSLTNVFHTRHGREVRDGGGLKPDSIIDWGKISTIVYNAVSDNWVFDYATRFAAAHPTIAPAEEFVITDSIYADFKKSIDPEKFKYDRVMEEGLKALREMAEDEGYLNPETEEGFDRMKKLLTHDLDRDLDIHRADIEDYLGAEIASRYYYGRGRTGYTLRRDKALAKAKEIFSTPGLYYEILGQDNPTQTPSKKGAGKSAKKSAPKK